LYVRATAPDGTVLWNFVFDKSEACGQYSDRPHYFIVGHFTGGKHLDVFTWSMKPDPRAYVLDGRTGKAIYRKDDVPHIDRSFQAFGGRATVFDFNGDGADDILFTDPDYYCVADGKTGNLLVGPVELQPLLKWWAAYSTPIVLQPADAKAKPFVYLGGAYSSRCAISLDGKQCLFKEYVPTERWSILDGPARFIEGLLPPSKINDKWRVAQVEASGTLQLFEAESGKHIWSTNIATDAGTILSGDIDGDGEPELLFGGKDGKLHCIRDAGREPKMVWTKAFDAPIASVLFADINGDGKCEIIASVGDGNVYVLDGKSDT
jgi:outer membrane protein assembly factor BamB